MSKVSQVIKEHKFDTYWDYRNFRVIDCRTCGFMHLDPIPEMDLLNTFYREDYFIKVKPFSYEQVTEEFVQTRIEQVYDSVSYQELYQKIMEYKKASSQVMLDIGCGNQLLTKFFEKQGWNVCALEPSEDAGKYLRRFGIPVFNKPVEEIDVLNIQNISFVNMQFVLEHLPDPYQVLLKIQQRLEPGGVIRICVPNDFSEGQLAYLKSDQAQPGWINIPDHINYFNFNSLHKLLHKTGFREVYRTTDFPLEFLLLGGLNYYANEAEKAKIRPFVTNFVNSFYRIGREDLLKALYEHLAQLGFGRSIFMYAIKE